MRLANHIRAHVSVRRVVPNRYLRRSATDEVSDSSSDSASRQLCGNDQLVKKIGSKKVWERGSARGAGIKIGIMDTGVSSHQPN